MRPLFATAALLSMAVGLPALAQRGDRTEIPLLTVNGTGEVRVAPDEATVRFGVTRQGSSAQRVQEDVNQAANAILEAVTKLGVDRDQIQTGRITLHPTYSQPKPGSDEPARIVGYRASNIVNVRLQRLDLTGPVIDAGLKAGSNQLEGVSFSLRNDGPARQEALRKAVVEAREKAQTLAQALDVRLGAIHEVQEGGVGIVQPVFREAAFARAGAADATPVLPGQVTVNASVTVRYRIGER